jgi:SWI/SNF-related matrix-associated actin-dependent regulator of chromatin subfamily A3
LIVSPLSLLSNWTSQIEEHLQDSTLSYLVFHGSTKKDAKIDLDEYDVIITSYGSLMSDYKSSGLEQNPGKVINKTKRGLFGRLWRRVVLDEGHTIRNERAKNSRAASNLQAVTRWSLTGPSFPFPNIQD